MCRSTSLTANAWRSSAKAGPAKPTLLRCFNRLVEPDSGAVSVNDADVGQANEVELRRHIGYVMQEGGLMPHWTVRRNVELVPWLMGLPNAGALVREAMGLVGFTDSSFDRRYPRQLSGGQRQRVAMARALAARPTVLLLDEPFGALDAITRADLQEMFMAVRKQRPVTCVLVTHDLFEAQRLADRIAVMRAGTHRADRRVARRHRVAGDDVRGASRGEGRASATRPATMKTVVALVLGISLAQGAPRERPIIVASKPFGESYILCEMFAQLLEARGFRVDRRPGLGATEIAFAALQNGSIDVYPEYTGTGLLAILGDTTRRTRRAGVHPRGNRVPPAVSATWLPPLGFENTYAISVRRETAAQYSLRTLTDLGRVAPSLRAGFTADFIGRHDGLARPLARVWPGVS